MKKERKAEPRAPRPAGIKNPCGEKAIGSRGRGNSPYKTPWGWLYQPSGYSLFVSMPQPNHHLHES